MCKSLNYFEHFIFISAVSGYVSISALVSLVGIPIIMASSSIGLKICVVFTGIRKYK